MQYTHPHAEGDKDRVTLHGSWADTAAGEAGMLIAYCNASTPGFADRRLAIGAGNTVDLDLTGYRLFKAGANAAVQDPVIAGILDEDQPGRALSTFPTHAFPPINVTAYGTAVAKVYFPTAVINSGTAIIPDPDKSGWCRPFVGGGNVLSESEFTTQTKWVILAEMVITPAGELEYVFAATGTGRATQTIANFRERVRPNTTYALDYEVTTVTAGLNPANAMTIPNTFASVETVLPATLGWHRVVFTTAATVGNFVIDVGGGAAGVALAGDFAMDHMTLTAVENDDARQHLVVGHTLERHNRPTNELTDPGFAVPASWTTTGECTVALNVATFAHAVTGDGTLGQTEIQRAVVATDSARYRFTYTGTVGGGGFAPASFQITNNFASVAVDLPQTTGTHSVDFTSQAGASTADFTIECSTMGAGESYVMDDVYLENLETEVRVMVRCM